MDNINDLFDVFPRSDRVEWIGIRPERNTAVEVVDSVAVSEKKGLVGDHYRGQSGSRHVTLIQAEHLPLWRLCLVVTTSIQPWFAEIL